MHSFVEFLDHDDAEIVDIAAQLSGYETMVNAGQISKSEFEELANDLLEYSRVDKLAGDIERQVMFKKAFDALKSIVGVISGL